MKGIHSQNLAYRLSEDQINVGLASEDRINVVDCTVEGFVDSSLPYTIDIKLIDIALLTTVAPS